jgi:SagB-type dehydrogenase family enzyme
VIARYHDGTKHHFDRFARSLGYLDWASQPNPFRSFHGAPEYPLFPRPGAIHSIIGDILRHSLGLSAWKEFRGSRWSLRVNPSSGNLHPTEAYVVCGPTPGMSTAAGVYHYAADRHALEQRCAFDPDEWHRIAGPASAQWFVVLTSIHWREAWKYGERAFRYCQHDTGHALAALRIAASMLGWTLTILPRWSDTHLSTLLGVDRDNDFDQAEREEVECLAVVTAGEVAPWLSADPAPLADAAREAAWCGRANRLSADHVDWPIIGEVAEATRYPGVALSIPNSQLPTPNHSQTPTANSQEIFAREAILKRRSAVAFDAQSGLARDEFFSMLARLRPGAPPWDAIDWPPQVHLVLFIHRVEGVTPGVYAFLRDPTVLDEWRVAMRPEFLWESVSLSPGGFGETGSLFLLFPADVKFTANRLSCDQEIAADGFFSLGMIARLESSVRERGEWFYRRLFWECGMIGQVLYLEAEAAGARGTGIGCFYDDAVHELLALSDERWQSLYHFSMGVPVEDTRLTTEPGYP